MHRVAHETPVSRPPPFPRVGIDLVTRDGRAVASADTWDGIIAMVPTLRAGEYAMVDSCGLRLGSIVVERGGAWIVRGMRLPG